jgi:hypothetical protein
MKISLYFLLILLFVAGYASAGELDNYYLEKFGEIASTPGRTVRKTNHTPIAQKCATPLRKELKTDWNRLESSTRKTLVKHLGKPALDGEKTYLSASGHFIIHYATSGVDSPPMAAIAPHETPSWVITVAEVFENVFEKEVTVFGYKAPVTMPYPVYLQQLATATPQVFGFTDSDILSDQSATSYITIDNDFTDDIYRPYNGLTGLQITAAHEFHHAIQFYYNYFFETWYGEATSSWMEDEVYDSINQLYSYSIDVLQNPSSSLDQPTDGGYGRWIFNRSLAENHNVVLIRSIWEKLQNTRAQNGNDIPMLPVIDRTLKDLQSSLSTEFVSFAKRLYSRNWSTHSSDLDKLYAVPLTMAATFSTYPINHENSPAATASLPHYSIKYFKFIPTSSVTDLIITVNQANGIQTAMFRKTSSGSEEITADITHNVDSRTYKVNSFGLLDQSNDEVVLMAANTTDADNLEISFSSDGSLRPATDPPTTAGNSSKSGCFIATAAYGSYLHPKVMLLRNFRDRVLLTNIPGRAAVTIYYKLSPPFAAFIARHETLRFITRLLLAPLIFAVEHFWFSSIVIIVCACIFLLRACRQRKRNNYVRQYSC